MRITEGIEQEINFDIWRFFFKFQLPNIIVIRTKVWKFAIELHNIVLNPLPSTHVTKLSGIDESDAAVC